MSFNLAQGQSLGDAANKIERYRQQTERERADARKEARDVVAKANLDAAQEVREAEARGAGAVALDGRMIDEAVAVAARRVLARAEGS